LAGLLVSCQNGLANQKGKERNSQNMDPINGKPEELSIDGEYLRAFIVAYEDFKEDNSIPFDKKRIENYNIKFKQDTGSFYILFLAKRTLQEKGSKGGSSSLGQDVEYSVTKDEYKIKRKQFFK
jgi:hypothetical protein